MMRRWLLIAGLMVLWGAWFVGVGWLLLIPSLDVQLTPLLENRPTTLVAILDGRGRPIDHFAEERRVWVPLREIPDSVSHAVLAAEDRRFWDHPGVDPIGILRAFWENQRAGEVRQGGSTITQQLIKLRVLDSERTLSRKVREALLAVRLEQLQSKEWVLEMYLNQVYLGAGNHGMETAARDYFGRSIRDVDAGQAALLAGVIREPGRTDPRTSPVRAAAGRARVLHSMVQSGHLHAADAEIFGREPIYPPLRTSSPTGQPVDAWRTLARRELRALFGDDWPGKVGLTVRTTLDADLQNASPEAIVAAADAIEARQGMREPDGPLTPTERVAFLDAAADLPQAGTGGGTEVPGPDHCFAALATGAPGRVQAGPFTFRLAPGELNRRVRATSPSERPRTVRRWMRAGTVWRVCVVAADRVRIGQPHWVEGAAVVLENHTGEVLAATGGRGMELEGFHRGTQAARQPGSSFKPVVYAAALQSGMTRRHTVLDAPLTIRDSERTWTPQNYGRTFSGPVRLEDAFARSLNTAAIRLVQRVGADAVVEEARALGYHSPMRADLSIALGTSEVTVLEQAVMVSTLVNGGRRRDPVFIREIQDASGTVWRAGDTVAHPALPSVVTLPGAPQLRSFPGQSPAKSST